MSSQQPHVPPRRSGKVLIPRLDRPREPPKKLATPRKGRVSRACLSCRARTIKCNGARPTCQNCVDSSGRCVYAASHKDRLKTLPTKHNQDLLQLLQDLRPGASPQEKQKIDDVLAGATEDVAKAASMFPKSPDESSENAPNFNGEDEYQGDVAGEANGTAEVGSYAAMGNMGEDTLGNQQSRASGYIGTNSEVQWLRRLHHEADSARSDSQGPYGPPGNSAKAHTERMDSMRERQKKDPRLLMSTSSCSFYLDEEPLDFDMDVNPYEMPPYEMAESLLNCYMQTVQNSFPILSQKLFTKQFVDYYNSVARGAPHRWPQKWQAMLNLVFAIGAAYSHLVESHWSANGLHIRNEDRTATAVKKETLARIWWAVYSLDRNLSAVTGRPSVGAEIYPSTTLPLPISANDIDEVVIQAKFGRKPNWGNATAASPLDAGSFHAASTMPQGNPANAPDASYASDAANGGTFLIAIVKLGMVSSNVLTQLYSPNLGTKSWKDVQGSIARLAENLDAWLDSLPTNLDHFKDNARYHTMQQEQNILKTYYYSTKILICRPCLCRLGRRIPLQTQSSVNFNHQIAAECVAAAKSIAACLPDDMAVWGKEIYNLFPWWSVVHYLMQSIAILLLEACYEAEGISVLPAVKKLVRWLRELSSTNRTAERAYLITVVLLRKMASCTFKYPRTARDITLLLFEHPSPTASDVEASGFSAQWYSDEASFEQSPPPHYTRSQDETFMANISGDTIPAVGVFPGAAGLPVSGFFDKALHSHLRLANVFFTEFDQYNPFSFDEGGAYMQGR
ncbi:fungal specific transcription factor domain-containing protein [Paraphaeosphaeria sporulosa]